MMKKKTLEKKPELSALRPQGRGSPKAAAAEAGQPVVVDVPKGKLALIKERCKGCGFCIEFCPKKVLEFSSETNAKGYRIPMVKDPDNCILCGFCSMYCPDFAIYQIRQDHCKQTRNDKAGKKP